MSMQLFSAKSCCLAFAVFFAATLCLPACYAGPAEAYQQAITVAAQGEDREAVTALAMLVEAMPEHQVWKERMFAAQILIAMRAERQITFPPRERPNAHLALASAYAAGYPQMSDAVTWPAAALATLFPGAGHAWQGRWRDAATAALMVWPMLLLTLWAARRRMGPVTLFFALITLWFWSGTIFSSISLAERGNMELYLTWWQGLWQASGLPGRPWI